MHLIKKKRQHYIWRKYLRKWSAENSIYCLMDDKVFNTSLMNIGQEKYFYRLKELSLNDISFLKQFVNKGGRPILRELNYRWIHFFNIVYELRKEMDGKQLSSPEIDRYFDVIICNYEEDYHSSIELAGSEFLELLYMSDLSFYSDDKSLVSFLNYLCVQYFRTQRMASSVSQALKGFQGINADAVWPVLRHISATNVGFSFYEEKSQYSLIILENNTATPFITGDQPVINTYAVGLKDEEVPEEIEFYYPLTPSAALLLTKEDKYVAHSVQLLSEEKVLFFNKAIYEMSEKQVYSNCPEVLREIIGYRE